MYVVYRVSQFCLFRVAPVVYCLVLFCCVLVSVELRFGHASLSTSISRRVPDLVSALLCRIQLVGDSGTLTVMDDLASFEVNDARLADIGQQ